MLKYMFESQMSHSLQFWLTWATRIARGHDKQVSSRVDLLFPRNYSIIGKLKWMRTLAWTMGKLNLSVIMQICVFSCKNNAAQEFLCRISNILIRTLSILSECYDCSHILPTKYSGQQLTLTFLNFILKYAIALC